MSYRKPFRAVPIKLGYRYRARARRRRCKGIGVATAVLSAAALIGGAIGLMPSLSLPSFAAAPMNTASGSIITGCSATDGDTLKCGRERIRLLGIDAPEMPGHCRKGRDCAPGDPYASTASLEAAMIGALRIERTDEDRYGRTLAAVRGDKGDLSCWQLQHGKAIYKPQWDDGGRVRSECKHHADNY